jgi:hypothetical protein
MSTRKIRNHAYVNNALSPDCLLTHQPSKSLLHLQSNSTEDPARRFPSNTLDYEEQIHRTDKTVTADFLSNSAKSWAPRSVILFPARSIFSTLWTEKPRQIHQLYPNKISSHLTYCQNTGYALDDIISYSVKIQTESVITLNKDSVELRISSNFHQLPIVYAYTNDLRNGFPIRIVVFR